MVYTFIIIEMDRFDGRNFRFIYPYNLIQEIFNILKSCTKIGDISPLSFVPIT